MTTPQQLLSRTRPPVDTPEGALVLLHGRGADEHDLFPLFDMLDPERRLTGICPRGPLSLPPGGAHWYQVVEVGYPDPGTFHPTFELLQQWLDATIERLGIEMDRVVVGGFSQGCVMSYALSLGKGRPRPAGLIGLSGFVPSVDGFDLELADLLRWPAAIGHGVFDPVIGVDWGRKARDVLRDAGADVVYHESPVGHTIDPAFIAEVRGWIDRVLG